MELDEIKKELNVKLAGPPQQHSAADIAALLQKQTASLIYQLNRSLWIELAITAFFTVVCVCMLFYSHSYIYRLYFGAGLVAALVFMAMLYRLIKKIKRNNTTLPVKQNIEKVVIILTQYIKTYLQLTAVLLPLCFVFGLWLAYNNPQQTSKPVNWEFVLYLSLIMLTIAGGLYFFTRWYLKKMYGNYLQKLRQMLQEFEEE